MYILSLLQSETSIFHSLFLSVTLPSPIHTHVLHHLHFSKSQSGYSMIVAAQRKREGTSV